MPSLFRDRMKGEGSRFCSIEVIIKTKLILKIKIIFKMGLVRLTKQGSRMPAPLMSLKVEVAYWNKYHELVLNRRLSTCWIGGLARRINGIVATDFVGALVLAHKLLAVPLLQ